jgi:4-hydroxy-3-methylbut-2-enyl diphosphate reductase
MINRKNKIFYFGLKNHSETKYIMSMNKSIKLIESLNGIKNIKSKIYLVNQSTIPVNTIKEHICNNKNISHIKTTCSASNLRYNNILKLPKNIDLLLIVGDKTSNNTMSLVNLGKQMKIKTKLVQSQNDIIKSDFNDIKTCYLTSGTSTTKKDVEDIYKKITSFNS